MCLLGKKAQQNRRFHINVNEIGGSSNILIKGSIFYNFESQTKYFILIYIYKKKILLKIILS